MTGFASAFIAVFLAAYVLVVGKAILVPLVIALFLWHILTALAKAYARFLPHFPRSCLTLSIATFIAVVWLPVELTSAMIPRVVEAAPLYQANLEELAAKFMLQLNIEQLPAAEDIAGKINIGAIVAATAQGVADVTGYTLMVLVYLLFLFLEQGSFGRKLSAMFSNRKKETNARRILENISRRIQTYLGIKTLISLMLSVLSYGLMMAVGLDFAAFWAVLIFILNFIPTIGAVIATIFPALLALVQFENLYPFLIVTGGITVLQFFVANLLETKLMGRSLNLSPVALLLSLVIWGSIWGIPGMFLCVPITVVAMIIMSEFPSTRPFAILLSGNGRIESP